MVIDYPLDAAFKADLTLNMEFEMPPLSYAEVEFDRFPVFPGNERASRMEIEIFEIVSKTFIAKLFSCSVAFREMEGKVLNGLV